MKNELSETIDKTIIPINIKTILPSSSRMLDSSSFNLKPFMFLLTFDMADISDASLFDAIRL
jgi:hypothetical protein